MHRSQPTTPRRQPIALGVLACGLVAMAGLVWAQKTSAPLAAPAATASSSAVAKPQEVKTTKPDWKELSPAQQAALKPLGANWATLSPGQKNKWLEISKNFASLPATEQATMHNRMASWATLSPQQRAQARLNFSEHKALTDGLTPEQRKAQWQAYQLLSPEEKKKLAASSEKPAPGTAPATRTTEVLKSSPPPQFGTAKVLGQQGSQQTTTSKISVAPHIQKGNSVMADSAATPAAKSLLVSPPAGAAAPSKP
jgi:Protein of unknown function (DUF3106)